MKEPLHILTHPPSRGSWNMAVDQFLMEDSRAWLRFYQWIRPTLSLGYFQPRDEVEWKELPELGVDLVRRLTGGKAVLHQHELTYSITCPVDWFPGPLLESYRLLGESLVAGLRIRNISADLVERKPAPLPGGNCFQVPGWFEVTQEDRKLIGSAQTRRRGRLLQHGSLLTERDEPLIRRLFAHSPGEELHAVSLSELTDNLPDRGELITAMLEGFQKTLKRELIPEELTQKELAEIERIERERYASDDWTKKR